LQDVGSNVQMSVIYDGSLQHRPEECSVHLQHIVIVTSLQQKTLSQTINISFQECVCPSPYWLVVTMDSARIRKARSGFPEMFT